MFTGFVTVIIPNGVKNLERPNNVDLVSNCIIVDSIAEAYDALDHFTKQVHKFIRIGIPVNNTKPAFDFIRHVRTELWDVNISVVCQDRSKETIEKLKKLKVNQVISSSCLSIVN